MKFSTYLPDAALRPYIFNYWTLDAQADSLFDSTKLLPDGTIQVIIHFGHQYLQKEGESLVPQGNCFVHGQLPSAIQVMAEGSVDILGVKFTPTGWSAFSKIPAKALTGYRVFLSDIWKEGGDPLHEELQAATSAAKRLQVLDDFFLSRLKPPADPTIMASVRYQYQQLGNIRVPDLANRFHRTQRTLERQYAQHVGLSPKQLAQIIRVQEVIRAKFRAPEKVLAELAFQFGYFDPAHFNREFRKTTGSSPQAFFERESKIYRGILGAHILPKSR
ncbi:MAG: helix-turn-helix domain-containing protein [Bacteroidota bacterium]